MDAKAKKDLIRKIDKNIKLYENCIKFLKTKTEFSDEFENMRASIVVLKECKKDLKKKNAQLEILASEVNSFDRVYDEIRMTNDFLKSYVQDPSATRNQELIAHVENAKEHLNMLFDKTMPPRKQTLYDFVEPRQNWSMFNNEYIKIEKNKIQALIEKVPRLINPRSKKWDGELKKIRFDLVNMQNQHYLNTTKIEEDLNKKIEVLIKKMRSSGDTDGVKLLRNKFPDPLTLKFANLAKSGAVVPKQLPSNQPKLSEKSPSPFLPSHKEPIRLGTIPEEPELENKPHQEFLKQLESAINTFDKIYTNVYSKFSLVDKDELRSFFEQLKHSVKINPDKTIEEIHLNVLGVLQEKEIEGLPKFPSLSEQARENGYTEKTYGMVIALYKSCFSPILDRTFEKLKETEADNQARRSPRNPI